MSERVDQLMSLHSDMRELASLFCCLIEKIDGTSDPNEVAKVQALIEAAAATFDDTPIFEE